MKFWAPTANYPAGANPWSGQPTKVNPNYTYVTPGIAVAAQEFNYELNFLSQLTAAGVSVPGATFTSKIPSSKAWSGAAWSQKSYEWLICQSGTSGFTGTDTCNVFKSQGDEGGADFSSVDSGGGISLAGFIDSATFDGTHYFCSAIKSDHSLNIYRCSPLGAWSLVFSDSSFTYSGSFLTLFNNQINCLATSTTTLISTASGFGGGGSGQWSGLIGGTSGGSSVARVLSGETSGRILFFPDVVSPASYMYTNDPSSTWVTASAAFLSHTNEIATGLCWSQADSCFVLTSYSSTTSRSYTYQSPEGLTWTLVNTLATFPIIGGVAATLSGVLSAFTIEGGATSRLLYSLDGGVTWYLAGYKVNSSGLAIGSELNPRVVGGPNGFAAWSTLSVRFSARSGIAIPLT
jgi:hypothetical protein